jgi:hypothetical protein
MDVIILVLFLTMLLGLAICQAIKMFVAKVELKCISKTEHLRIINTIYRKHAEKLRYYSKRNLSE